MNAGITHARGRPKRGSTFRGAIPVLCATPLTGSATSQIVMIKIYTIGDRRVFSFPRALVDVAVALFDNVEENIAVYQLAKKFSANNLHTLENVALYSGHTDALKYAKQLLST